MNFIKLTGYFPEPHLVVINTAFIAAILDNTLNENSSGSIVYAQGEFLVRETPEEILKLIEEANL